MFFIIKKKIGVYGVNSYKYFIDFFLNKILFFLIYTIIKIHFQIF